jgi:hypothetical protein
MEYIKIQEAHEQPIDISKKIIHKQEKVLIISKPDKINKNLETINNIHNNKYSLEEGDYFPFISIKYDNGYEKHFHNYVDNKEFMIIIVDNIEKLTKIKDYISNNCLFHYIILYKEGIPCTNIKSFCSKDCKIYNMFKSPENHMDIYTLTTNRKIYKKYEIKSANEFNTVQLKKNIPYNQNVPYLLVNNVLGPELIKKILHMYDIGNKQSHNTSTKNRQHTHPNKELEFDIDNKLSRSLFPEIRKIFYLDVKYRELYKICCYSAETDGRFHAHRDTPHPFQHRRFAMSLCLNDDYEGGEFEFPEYNLKIKPKTNSALIFPGICSHKVNQVTKGTRKVIITFFCSEIEGKTKDNKQYMVKSNFFKENEIKFSNIYPK